VITTFVISLCLLASPEDAQRAKEYLQDQQASGLFGPCGNRKENIAKFGPENPYVQLSPKDFKTIKQWGKLARSEPREMFGHQYLASSTVADIAILHGRGVHRLGQTELEECRGEMLKMLKAKDSNVRGHALKGLAAIGDRDHFPDIRNLLKDENGRVRMFAKEALAAIEEREKKKDKSHELRATAATADIEFP